MKTEREVLEYVYNRMVSGHMEPTSQWYMLELRRIINRMGTLQMLIPESAGGWIYHVEETGEVRIVQDGKVKVDTIKPWERWTPLRFYVEQVIDKIEHGERGAGDDYPVVDKGDRGIEAEGGGIGAKTGGHDDGVKVAPV